MTEKKTHAMFAEVENMKAEVAKAEASRHEMEDLVKSKEADMDEMRMQMLKIKSELIDKEAQIEQLFQTLTAKGEEAGELSRKLIQLKNHILDQSLFEENYRVVRMPFSPTENPFIQMQA